MTAPTVNTAPLDDWRADDPPICPTCGTDCGYWAWEDRDSIRGVIRENAALRARVARLKELIAADAAYSAVVRNPRITASERAPLFDRLSNARWATQVYGDLDGAGEGGE